MKFKKCENCYEKIHKTVKRDLLHKLMKKTMTLEKFQQDFSQDIPVYKQKCKNK